MIKKSITVLLVLISTIDLFSQKIIEFSEKPSWVKEIEYPKESSISKYDIKSGVYYKLIDYQTNLSEDASFNHFVQNVVTSGGVTNASQVQINYDTSYQKLSIHYLRIIRRDQVIDKSDIAFEFIKNEQQLQTNIYTGRVTALAFLEDIRKGDIIEIGYTLVGDNPVFEDQQFVMHVLEDINPIDRVYVRVLFPDNEGFAHESNNSSRTSIKEGVFNELVELIYDSSNVEALELEETMAPWIIPYKYLIVSSTNSWKDVNDWSKGLFKSNETKLIAQVYDEIFYEDYKLDDKINAIIDFVQDDIRYMGIETGMGSIMPFSPDQVIRQRFGDCKDKSLLMSTLMKGIGIEKCYPVLISTWLQHNIATVIPNGQWFDHVIIHFEHNGSKYWVDPTASYQGGDYKALKTYNYGSGLVVRDGEIALTEMSVTDTTSITIVDEYFNGSTFDSPGALVVKTKLIDTKADFARQILEYYSKKELAESYKYYYSLAYPSLQESEKLSIKDDQEKNVMLVEENYQIDKFWNDNMEGYKDKYTFTYEPTALYGYLGGIACEEKQYPLSQNYPYQLKLSAVIDFPDPIEINDDEKRYDNEAFFFRKNIKLIEPKRVKLDYYYKSKTKEVSTKKFKEICAEINEIMDGLPIVFYFPKTKFNPSSLFNNQYKIQLSDIPLKSTKYHFDEIINSNKTGEIIGLVKFDDDKLTAAVFDESLKESLKSYFDKNLDKSLSSTPLTLTINELRISENVLDARNKRAVVEFIYKVSYLKDNEMYEYVLSDKIESSGRYLTSMHEKNIRRSFQLLLNGLNEEVFVKATN